MGNLEITSIEHSRDLSFLRVSDSSVPSTCEQVWTVCVQMRILLSSVGPYCKLYCLWYISVFLKRWDATPRGIATGFPVSVCVMSYLSWASRISFSGVWEVSKKCSLHGVWHKMQREIVIPVVNACLPAHNFQQLLLVWNKVLHCKVCCPFLLSAFCFPSSVLWVFFSFRREGRWVFQVAFWS